jgi:hypothetical protein
MPSGAYFRVLSAGGYMIGSAIIALAIAYLPVLAGAILSTLNILPAHPV